MRRTIYRWGSVVCAVVVCALVFGAGAADAASGGYGAGAPGAPGAVGAFSTVVSVQTVPATGGSVTCATGGASIVVTVPAGDFTAPVQVVCLAGSLAVIGSGGIGGTPIVAFGVQLDQNSVKLPGPFTNPIGLAVADAGISSASVVYDYTGTSYVPAPGWTDTTGDATGSFSTDVDYLIDTPPTPATAVGAPISGATTAITGKPFLGEALVALALLGLGAVGALGWRRQRRQSRA